MYPWEGPMRTPEMQTFQKEETLLKLHVVADKQPDLQASFVLPLLQKYIQSFAFAAVLPVQPLTYTPTDDGGVQVKFLRKKTKEKGSLDGGLRFWILQDKPPQSTEGEDENNSAVGFEIVVKRISEGQTITKMFSEKQVIQAFVAAFTGDDPEKSAMYSNQPPPTSQWVTVESVFYKWMDV